VSDSVSDKIGFALQLLREAQESVSGSLKENRTPERGALNADLWKLSKMQTMFPQYFSQAGQDMFLDQYVLDTKRGGTFVDVGAYDGVTASNSLFFEAFRGWFGVLVEPVPAKLDLAVSWRKAPAFGYAVGPDTSTKEFLTVVEGFTQMSGFLESYDPETLKRVREHPNHKERISRLPRRTLADILTEAGLSKVDYLSLDVRGGEIEIIESLDLEAFEVETLSVENATHDERLWKMLKQRGYRLLEFFGTDEIYGRAKA